jgi:superfamily II DNA or RNA helicase
LLPPEDADAFDLLFNRIIRTGRAFWHNRMDTPLTLGSARDGAFQWMMRADASQSLEVVLSSPELFLLNGASPWYVDQATAQAGAVTLPFSAATTQALRSAPKITIGQVEPICAVLKQMQSQAHLQLPLPHIDVSQQVKSGPPVPRILLQYQNYKNKVLVQSDGKGHFLQGEDALLLSYDYGFDSSTLARSWETHRWTDGRQSIITKRHPSGEMEIDRRLSDLGFVRTMHPQRTHNRSCWVARNHGRATWLSFVQDALPLLREQGWQITIDPSFQFQVVEADENWHVQIDESSAWWFSLDLGIHVDGQRIPLLPVLTQALNVADAGLSTICPDELNKGGKFYAPLPDGRICALPFERVKAILSCLLEVLSKNALGNERLTISLPHVMDLLSSQDASRLSWQGGESLRSLAASIKAFDWHQPIDEPAGLCTTLRPYQREGLRWLEFISTLKLGGLLADDMGLGKTVQTIAHILREKEQGRLDRPCLVLCPTSVVSNWVTQARCLAPDLRVLTLHGSTRANQFDKINSSDIVLSTYPLLVRDTQNLVPVKWHAVILDEAQAIKNYNTRAAQTAMQLDSRYRLALTGTPIENHLLELWSQFNFLMPGLLGNKKTFEKVFQEPIEVRGEQERLQLLSSRIAPFMMRRTKDLVARDLPAKTTMIKYVEMEGQQRDLYETVRLSMHQEVLAAVKKKGLASVQLIILDALMKLRQVCCDPRLVKLPEAAGIEESAKLNCLNNMLGELIEEGRRILVFSQFTSMLDLIAVELRQQGIPYVELRGDTRDRAGAIEQFQNGKTPIFLISLKAGGAGLNLTAADTVIHYDPWWNPAVEEQATDRAHRIGQDKPVFVYRLVAGGTIEQLMLDLQERKRALANSLLKQTGAADVLFTYDEADLSALFAPMK